MTVLWIPHSPPAPGAVRRDQHLIRHLRDEHRIISVTWETKEGTSGLQNFLRGLRRYSFSLPDGRKAYHVRRLPDVTRPLRGDGQTSSQLNEYLFQKDIRAIIREEEVDLLLTAYTRYMTGLPPLDVEIPVVFDYLDCARWTSSTPGTKPYIEKADLVLCVSALAEEQAQKFNQNTEFLPNGADITRLRNATGNPVRKKHGITDAKVISLIGLGASGSHYFIDAVRRARKHVPELKCLLVGESSAVRKSLNQLSPNERDAFIYAGAVPYDDAASYFAASDVGIYPVDGISYDDGRSPIKIFEYTALGVPVVVPRIREVERLGFENIVYAEPTPSAFADGIFEALNKGRTTEPSIEKYDWKRQAKKIDDILCGLTVS